MHDDVTDTGGIPHCPSNRQSSFVSRMDSKTKSKSTSIPNDNAPSSMPDAQETNSIVETTFGEFCIFHKKYIPARYYVDVASCMICYWQYTVWYSTESIAIYSTKCGQYWLQVSRHISHMAHGMLINESWPRRVMKGTGYIWIGVTNGKPFQQLDWWNLTLKFNRNLSCEIVLYIYKDL